MSKAAELAKMGEVLTNGQIGGRRNIIINGAMQVSQRGTSSASVTSAEYLVDRFQGNISSLGTWTLSQSTTAPDGFSNSFKMDCTTANASPASGAFLNCRQKIEGQDLQRLKYGTSSAETLTVSFHVRSNKTGTYIVELLQPDASNRHRGASYTIDSANTWEKKIVIFSGDTSGVINNDTGDGIQLTWWLGSGSNFNSGTLQTDWGALDQTARAVGNVNLADSTDNEWYITGVQMEVGTYSNGTPFEHRSFGEEFSLCSRYYEVAEAYGNSYHYNDQASSSDREDITATYKVEKRATPTLTVTNQSTGSLSNLSNTTKKATYRRTGSFGSTAAYSVVSEAEL